MMFDRFRTLLEERATFVRGSTIGWGAIDGNAAAVGTTRAEGPRFFAVGSLTKVLTGTLLTLFSERGQLRLDTRLGDVLSDLSLGTEVANITLQQLATHTSGLPRLPQNLRPVDPGNPYARYGRAELFAMLTAISDGQIIDGRGEREYSNLGVGLLGTLLAVASNRPYEELLAREIFRPLGMGDTFVATSATPPLRAPALTGRDADGETRTVWTFDSLAPAGGLVSTIPDLMKFATALLDDEQWGLKKNQSWVAEGEVRWHNGQTASHHAMMGLDPARRHAAIALWDAAADLDDICLHILLPNRPVIAMPAEIDLESGYLHRYAGVYESGAAILTVTAAGNRLIVDSKLVTGSFYPLGDDVFFSKTSPILRLTFIAGAERITGIEVKMHAVTFMRADRQE